MTDKEKYTCTGCGAEMEYYPHLDILLTDDDGNPYCDCCDPDPADQAA